MNRSQKSFLASFLMLLISSLAYSQVNDSLSVKQTVPDSLRKKAVAYLAGKFADTRPINIEYTQQMPSTYEVEPQTGATMPNGKIKNFSMVKTNLNYNFLRKQTWMLGASFEYRLFNMGTEFTDQSTGTLMSVNNNFHYHSSSLNFTYFSKLFGKTVVYGATASVDGGSKGFERVRGLVYGTMILKSNDRTTMTAGAILNVGPNNQIPALPIFTYEHKFGKNMSIDVLLPRQLLLRKYFPTKSRLSIGAEMDQVDFFLYNVNSLNPKITYEWQQAAANTGLIYEHLLGDYFIATFRAGARVPFGGRFYEKNEVKDPIFKIKSGASLYFNVGISFNPFISKKR